MHDLSFYFVGRDVSNIYFHGGTTTACTYTLSSLIRINLNKSVAANTQTPTVILV